MSSSSPARPGSPAKIQGFDNVVVTPRDHVQPGTEADRQLARQRARARLMALEAEEAEKMRILQEAEDARLLEEARLAAEVEAKRDRLVDVYEAFCDHGKKYIARGMAHVDGMDNRCFIKCCKDSGIIKTPFCSKTECDVVFSRIKQSRMRVIDYQLFREAIAQLAGRRFRAKNGKQLSPEDAWEKAEAVLIQCGGPKKASKKKRGVSPRRVGGRRVQGGGGVLGDAFKLEGMRAGGWGL